METEDFIAQKKLAEIGDTDAQLFLATCYMLGMFVKRDAGEAVRWYKEAADRKDPRAQYVMALWCMDEKSSVHDEKQGFKYLSKAAGQGYERAFAPLAACYYNGTGTRKNRPTAIFWYERAACSGDARAACLLGTIYYSGMGVERNIDTAVWWLGLAADAGDSEAAFILGRHYFYGDEDGDVEKGLAYLEKAVKLKNIAAINFLAGEYEDGDIVEKNPEEAFKLYLKAAKLGDADAMMSVAEAYESGGAVEKDPAAAFKWRKKAADKGDIDAKLRTGLAYMEGDGVDTNLAKAEKYFVAVLGGNDGLGKNEPDGGTLGRACYYMGEICRRRGKNNVARSWYEKGAGYGDADCAAMLKKPELGS